MPQFFLGVNGGHHRSRAIAVSITDSDITIVGPVSGPPINLHAAEPTQNRTNLSILTTQIALRLGLVADDFRNTCIGTIGIPGAGTRRDQISGLTDLNLDQSRFQLVDDTWIGLYAHEAKSNGICAYAGTGASIVIANGKFELGKSNKIDGWGPIIGDFGSAFELSTETFRALGRLLDSDPDLAHQHYSALTSQLRLIYHTPRDNYDKFSLDLPTTVCQLQEWFDNLVKSWPHDWRGIFALAAAGTASLADSGQQPFFEDLVRISASRMCASIEIATARAPNLPIIMQAGMFRNCLAYRNYVHQHFQPTHPDRIMLACFEPAVGALLMAAKNKTDQLLAKLMAIDDLALSFHPPIDSRVNH